LINAIKISSLKAYILFQPIGSNVIPTVITKILSAEVSKSHEVVANETPNVFVTHFCSSNLEKKS
jgi:hypothetical protein